MNPSSNQDFVNASATLYREARRAAGVSEPELLISESHVIGLKRRSRKAPSLLISSGIRQRCRLRQAP